MVSQADARRTDSEMIPKFRFLSRLYSLDTTDQFDTRKLMLSMEAVGHRLVNENVIRLGFCASYPGRCVTPSQMVHLALTKRIQNFRTD